MMNRLMKTFNVAKYLLFLLMAYYPLMLSLIIGELIRALVTSGLRLLLRKETKDSWARLLYVLKDIKDDFPNVCEELGCRILAIFQ